MKHRYVLSVLLLLIIPVVLAAGILAALNFSIPSSISSPFLIKFSLLVDLLASNVWQAIKWLLFDVSFIAIEAGSGDNISWSIHWNIFNSLLLLVISIISATPMATWAHWSARMKRQYALALLLCWSTTLDVWLNGCCTTGPQWWPEVVLLAKAYASNPYIDTINWQGIYLKLSVIAPLLKVVLLAAGFVMLKSTQKKKY